MGGGVAVQKARISENKNVQPDIQFMTYDRSPAALVDLNDLNSLIIVGSANSTAVNTRLCNIAISCDFTFRICPFASHKGVCGSRRIAPVIRNLPPDRSKWVSFTHELL